MNNMRGPLAIRHVKHTLSLRELAKLIERFIFSAFQFIILHDVYVTGVLWSSGCSARQHCEMSGAGSSLTTISPSDRRLKNNLTWKK